jgi:hypothetical protein
MLGEIKREIIHALIGSANFSVKRFNDSFREVLAETTYLLPFAP